MSRFLRTFLAGIGIIFLLVLVAGFTALIGLRSSGDLPQAMRRFVLSEDEREALRKLNERPDEPPPVTYRPRDELDETLQRIAHLANESAVRELIENLSAREQALAERAELLAQQESELRLARTDLERMRRQIEHRRREVEAMLEEVSQRAAEWAAIKAREAKRLKAFSEVEQTRMKELAAYYEASRNAWDMLKTLEDPEAIARILLFMEPRKAAKVLDEAVKDPAYRDMPNQLHHAMLTLDKDGITGEQAARLADLYSLMRPQQVLPYLRDSSVDEIVDIFSRMPPRRAATLLESLLGAEPERGAEVQRRLSERAGGGAP